MEILALAGEQFNTLKFVFDFLSFHAPVPATLVSVQQPFVPVSEFPLVAGQAVHSVAKAAAALVAASPLASVLSLHDTPFTVDNLNEAVKNSVFISGHNLALSDLLAFPVAREFLATAPLEALVARPHLVRWFDHVQHLEGVPAAARLPLDVVALTAAVTKKPAKPAKAAAAAPAAEAKAAVQAAKGVAGTAEVRELGDFSRLEVVVGKIVRVWRHPEAERLWCEEIDCGATLGKRLIASGLREHYKTEAEMQGRTVLVLANLKPRPLRGFESHGMVLCASKNSEGTGAKELVEFLEPPKDAQLGDRVAVEGYVGEPDAVLNSKKNPFDVILPDIATNDQGVACFKGLPWLVRGEMVKAATARNASIH